MLLTVQWMASGGQENALQTGKDCAPCRGSPISTISLAAQEAMSKETVSSTGSSGVWAARTGPLPASAGDRLLTLETSGVEIWCMTSGFTPLACGLRFSARRLRRRPLSPLDRHPL